MALVVLAGILWGGAAEAWDSDAKWNKYVVGYRINPANKEGLNQSKLISALRDAASRWTKQSRAAFRFRYDGQTSQTTHGNDGKNIVVFRDAKKTSTSTARATTYWWHISGTIVDADIVYWGRAASFITGSATCNNQVYVENTGIHEFGHALGLRHSSVSGATMWSSSPACSKSHLSLHSDDKAGIEALYKCSLNSHCNDADICTKDVCGSNKLCTRSAIANCCTSASQCNDGKACTKDSCSNNKCVHTPISGCCTSASQCDDGNACTQDSCSDNACKHTPIPGCGKIDAGVPSDSSVMTPDASSGDDAGGDGLVSPGDAQPDADGDVGSDGPVAGELGVSGQQAPAQLEGGCSLAADERTPLWPWLGLLTLALLRRRRRSAR